MTKKVRTTIHYTRRSGAKYHALWAHARLLIQLTEYLHKVLPIAVSEHCVVSNLRNSELVIGADSPAWSARLRFYAPQILKHFNTFPGAVVRHVKIRTLPKTTPAKKRPRDRMRISGSNGKILEQTARTVTNSRLQAALRKLAARAL